MESLYSFPMLIGVVSFVLLAIASWCVGEGGEILGKKYDASIIGGLLIAWLNTGMKIEQYFCTFEVQQSYSWYIHPTHPAPDTAPTANLGFPVRSAEMKKIVSGALE